MLGQSACLPSFTVVEDAGYGWKASLEMKLLYLREAFPLFFFFNPLQEPRLSAVPKWNSALGIYEEGSRQELLIVSKNNSKRQANGNDWVLALYGYSNHFYIF